MTVAEFVAARFVPEHVAAKGMAGRRHYKAILKHILSPQEVDRIFGSKGVESKARLTGSPGWPYLTAVPMAEVDANHVNQLVWAAVNRGYSVQTAKHIRNVVGAIIAHAIKANVLAGTNPASEAELPKMIRKVAHSLSLEECGRVLSIMHYPERELTLFALLTGMHIAEICGLQWKNVNLTAEFVTREGEIIPPRTILVQTQWSRGELSCVRGVREKGIQIPNSLHAVLLGLRRPSSPGPWNEFVLSSRAGTPINQVNIAARRLKSIGQRLGMPWLSWQVVRRTHLSLIHQYGSQLDRHIAAISSLRSSAVEANPSRIAQ